MENFRLTAVHEMMKRKPVEIVYPSNKTSDYFGQNVFGKEKMKKYLSKEAYRSVILSMDTGSIRCSAATMR